MKTNDKNTISGRERALVEDYLRRCNELAPPPPGYRILAEFDLGRLRRTGKKLTRKNVQKYLLFSIEKVA